MEFVSCTDNATNLHTNKALSRYKLTHFSIIVFDLMLADRFQDGRQKKISAQIYAIE